MSTRSQRRQRQRQVINAILLGDLDSVSALLKGGADVNTRDEEHSETLLMIACSRGQTAIARLLLAYGADVNAQSESGRTALMSCSEEVGELLLEAGANINAAENEGRTALILAAEAGLDQKMRWLLAHGADPNVEDADGETARRKVEIFGYPFLNVFEPPK